MKRLIAVLAAALAMIGSGAAHAGAHWSIGIEIAPPVFYPPVPVYAPAPVYVPAPVYYEPRVMYLAPRFYQPAPVSYNPHHYYQGPTVIYAQPVYGGRAWYEHHHDHGREWDDDRYEHRGDRN